MITTVYCFTLFQCLSPLVTQSEMLRAGRERVLNANDDDKLLLSFEIIELVRLLLILPENGNIQLTIEL